MNSILQAIRGLDITANHRSVFNSQSEAFGSTSHCDISAATGLRHTPPKCRPVPIKPLPTVCRVETSLHRGIPSQNTFSTGYFILPLYDRHYFTFSKDGSYEVTPGNNYGGGEITHEGIMSINSSMMSNYWLWFITNLNDRRDIYWQSVEWMERVYSSKSEFWFWRVQK